MPTVHITLPFDTGCAPRLQASMDAAVRAFNETIAANPQGSEASQAAPTHTDSGGPETPRDYLLRLPAHDGIPRLEGWLAHACQIDLFGCTHERQSYLRLVSRHWAIAMVARAMHPGCKFPYAMVLHGPQGLGKSSLARALASNEFFVDTPAPPYGSEWAAARAALVGIWICEIQELSALNPKEMFQLKDFLASTFDSYRQTSGNRNRVDQPRQCVIVATTDERRFLLPGDDAQRFWPVHIEHPVLVDRLLKHRDQIFAEALAAFNAGHAWTPTQQEQKLYFDTEQAKCMFGGRNNNV